MRLRKMKENVSESIEEKKEVVTETKDKVTERLEEALDLTLADQ